MRLIRTGHQREPPPRAASVPRGAGILSGRSLATFAETCVIVDSIVGRRQGYWESANWAIAGRFRPYGRHNRPNLCPLSRSISIGFRQIAADYLSHRADQ